MHNTQEIVVENDEELRVKLNIYVTHDFVMENEGAKFWLSVLTDLKQRGAKYTKVWRKEHC
ncbi:hypothetical protein [Sphingobacterium sp. R2]|uniref:hypothetical protein n=1 Tax=Sphingobacterium sp. R2 TaxID=3112958 RepID=UPI00345DC74D